ncbi:hypothetical protein TWF696_005249 [Orbilia brochopaga]|uniref:RanBD1 domain-containing protein n=1 Tax=Orbilia brochopaga TaxID=3140254 RepID=A0AAV9V061_9PEZI
MVSTRSSKEASPIYPSQEPDIPVESPGSSQSQSQSPTGRSPTSGRKRRRSTRQSTPHSSSSGGESPKSDSSAREKMRRTKIEESTESAGSQVAKPSQNTDDEMIGVQVGEVSPGAKGRKRVHDEIASSSKDPKTPAEEPEDRPPSRQANGEPLGKKLRETPSPPREIDENSTLEPSVEQKQPDSPASENAASPPKEEIKLSGGFSNTSSVSPFGSLATKATEATTTSEVSSNGNSLFASSKFSSFSKVTSAFGVSPAPLGVSPFAAPPTGSDNVFSKMSSNTSQSMFPSASGPNVFAVMSGNTSASGFGGISTPALGSGTSIFGTTSSKPLPKAQPLEGIKAFEKSDTGDNQDSESVDGNEGASADAAEGEGHENGKSTSILPPKTAMKSGEEEYDMVFQARAKLFEFSTGAWKERGIGNVRVLTPKAETYLEADDGQGSKKTPVGRIVMRQEGVGRLILNANMFKDMLSDTGKQVSDNTIRFMAVNSVLFAETQDEKSKEDKSKDSEEKDTNDKETTHDEGAEKKKTDEPQPAITQKPALKTYLLRFKSSDLVAGFRDNVIENCPI